MKFRRIITAVISVIYICFFMLCCYSGPVEPGPVYVPLMGPARITLSAGTFDADTRELCLPAQPSDLELLGNFTDLRSLKLTGSSCYDEIDAWWAEHPDVDVSYTVSFPNGTEAEIHEENLDLSGMDSLKAAESAELLKHMRNVKAIELGSASAGALLSGDEISAIQAAAPEAVLSYQLELFGKLVELDTETIDLSAVTPEELEACCAALRCLHSLKTIDLGDDSSCTLGFEDIAAIQDAAPEAHINYSFSLWGQSIDINDQSMNFSHIPMDDNGDGVYSALSIMKNCSYVDMDSCGISNERMAEIRDAYPDTKVVWRIWFGTGVYSVRTDVETILASKPSKGGPLNNENVQNIRYCQNLKHLDIGHNECITDLSFAYGMPDLEVLIMMSDMSQEGLKKAPRVDLTPLASCPHLEYMELNSTSVEDLSPLSGLKELRHLNLGCCPNVSDISPLYGLTELERLWLGTFDPVPAEQVEAMKEAAPDCVIDTKSGNTPTEGAWRFADLNDRGWATWSEYGYFTFDNHPRYDLLREQFGYDKGLAAYSFAENDPLY